MKIFLALLIGLQITVAWAQSQNSPAPNTSSSDGKTSVGISSGPLLPKAVAGVREIVPLTALRFGFPSPFGQMEVEGALGNANGNSYMLGSLRLVYDFDYKIAKGLFFVGGDFHNFKTVRKIRTIFINGTTGETTEEVTFEPGPWRSFNGWHLGFGLNSPITDTVSFRGDALLRYSPGQTIYVGLGVDVAID